MAQNSSFLKNLRGVGEQTLAHLARLGITTTQQFLEHLPHRLEDRSQVRPIQGLPFSQEVVIEGTIKNVNQRYSKKGQLIIQARLADQSGEISALWFNQRFLLGTLKPGRTFFLFGSKQPSKALGYPFMVKKIITRPEIAPIYPTSGQIGQGIWRQLFIKNRSLLENVSDILPTKIRDEQKLATKKTVLEAAHFPQTPEDLAKAQEYLAFEELLVLTLAVLETKKERLQTRVAPTFIDKPFLSRFAAQLPFNLTAGQRRTAWEIIQQLTKNYPMRRLLYGEVGSGKTAVALLVAATVVKNGQKVLFLAPTTVLATQLAEEFERYFSALGYQVALLTAASKDGYQAADVVVGTHALLEKKDNFNNCGLLIIDEQHRFGVKQRQTMIETQTNCHVLMMSATPIPRSLSQTIFGYLDISYLLDKPLHQKPVKTVRFTAKNRPKIEAEIAERLKKGEPGFVVCPLIEPTPTELTTDLFALERKTIQGEEKRLKKEFPQAQIALLHGRLDEKEKQKIISDFRHGKIDILLATTVIEVGIDHPQASWILIEEANRFGLSQLHQLRGRVGRGERAAVCFVSDDETTPLGTERLKALVTTTDGLTLAEADLKLRGPGELTGFDQSGLPPLRYADLTNIEQVKAVFSIAKKIMAEGLAQHPKLRQAVAKRGNHDQTASL